MQRPAGRGTKPVLPAKVSGKNGLSIALKCRATMPLEPETGAADHVKRNDKNKEIGDTRSAQKQVRLLHCV